MSVKTVKNVVICGATSAIAQEVAKLFAAQGACLLLQSRDQQHLNAIRDDLLARGAAKVEVLVCDARELLSAESLLTFATEVLGQVDLLLLAFGTLGNQEKDQDQFDGQMDLFTTNTLAPFAILTTFANYMAQKKTGHLVVLSSVAGDRGRKLNYIYGASKAALTCYSSGLRARMSEHGVKVLTIKLGTVDTPMTAHLPRSPLSAKPNRIAHLILNGIQNDKKILYLPWYWRPIILIIKLIPESLFSKFTY